MAKIVRAKVKPEIMIWARKIEGFTITLAANRLKVPEAKLLAWEEGLSSPTIGQLQKMASIYRRPLSVFYLQEAPRTFSVMRDFRRLPGTEMSQVSPDLAYEIRMARQRRALALELLEETKTIPQEFLLSASLDEDPEKVGNRIRYELNVKVEEQKVWRTDPHGYKALNAWREKIENQGVLIFQMTHTTSEEVSGFAIADVILPTIGITQTDTPPTRRIFSILHEFAHLLLRQSGISDLDVDASRPPEDQRIEVFCNHVAAAVLIPKESLIAEKLLRENNFGKEDWPDEAIKQLALNYSVSREAFVRRLLTFDLVNRDFYEKKRTQYNEEYQQKKQIERERAKLEGRKIVKFPARDAINQLGRPLVGMILDSYYRDRLSLSDVSGFLGIRTRHLNKLEALVRAGKRL